MILMDPKSKIYDLSGSLVKFVNVGVYTNASDSNSARQICPRRVAPNLLTLTWRPLTLT